MSMSWQIRYTRTFLKEMAKLPADVRQRAEQIAFGDEIKQSPFLQGKTQKLSGFQNYYKIRVGNYRIGIQIDPEANVVEFQRVLHRREIYRKFP